MSLSEVDHALMFLSSVERECHPLTEEMTITLLYSKLLVVIKDRDWSSCDAILKSLLHLSVSYDIAADAVKSYLTSLNDWTVTVDVDSKFLTCFKLLIEKFPQ